jgi:hypothetical protein
LVQAGIVTASVAILIAFVAGTASKDNDLYRPIFAHALAPMAVTVVVSTISVAILQCLRFLWLLAPSAPPTGLFRLVHVAQLRALFRFGVFVVFLATIWLTARPGVEAAKYVVTGSLNVVENKCTERYLSAEQRRAVPWVLRIFYRGGPIAPCPR